MTAKAKQLKATVHPALVLDLVQQSLVITAAANQDPRRRKKR